VIEFQLSELGKVSVAKFLCSGALTTSNTKVSFRQGCSSDLSAVQQQAAQREALLSPHASKSVSSKRDHCEEPSQLRTEFQRDRDRIIHSKSFRRLKHKTQVFIAPTDDHYVTRLTHTLEVSQIARTISRALNLNEDLTEAISLGHDIGHTPFGHVGESEVNDLYPEGFRHAEQSLRLVEFLEKDGKGLNLTSEVRQGILCHSKPREDVLGGAQNLNLSLEGQVCRLSDAIAYLNHDIADAFRANILSPMDIPRKVEHVLGNRHSQRIDTIVRDVVSTTWPILKNSEKDRQISITMSPRIHEAVNSLRAFMFDKVYLPTDQGKESLIARKIIKLFYEYYNANIDEVPSEYMKNSRGVVDYIAGMTDHYAMRTANTLKPGLSSEFEFGNF